MSSWFSTSTMKFTNHIKSNSLETSSQIPRIKWFNDLFLVVRTRQKKHYSADISIGCALGRAGAVGSHSSPWLVRPIMVGWGWEAKLGRSGSQFILLSFLIFLRCKFWPTVCKYAHPWRSSLINEEDRNWQVLLGGGKCNCCFPQTQSRVGTSPKSPRRKNLWGPRAMSRFGDVAVQAATASGPGPAFSRAAGLQVETLLVVCLILSKHQRLGNIQCLAFRSKSSYVFGIFLASHAFWLPAWTSIDQLETMRHVMFEPCPNNPWVAKQQMLGWDRFVYAGYST